MKYKNYIITEEGSILSKKTGRQIYVHVNKKGYCSVRLKHGDGGKTHLVHRLVAELYVENPDSKEQVNHKDGVKANNNHWNLEWVTCQENNDHAVLTGLVKRGKDRPNSKMTDEQVLELRSLREEGHNYYELGRLFGIAYQTAHKICSRMTYTHI